MRRGAGAQGADAQSGTGRRRPAPVGPAASNHQGARMKRRHAFASTALIGAATLSGALTAPGAQAARATPSPPVKVSLPRTDSSLDRVQKTGVLRAAVSLGQAAFFTKGLMTGQWGGACI